MPVGQLAELEASLGGISKLLDALSGGALGDISNSSDGHHIAATLAEIAGTLQYGVCVAFQVIEAGSKHTSGEHDGGSKHVAGAAASSATARKFAPASALASKEEVQLSALSTTRRYFTLIGNAGGTGASLAHDRRVFELLAIAINEALPVLCGNQTQRGGPPKGTADNSNAAGAEPTSADTAGQRPPGSSSSATLGERHLRKAPTGVAHYSIEMRLESAAMIHAAVVSLPTSVIRKVLPGIVTQVASLLRRRSAYVAHVKPTTAAIRLLAVALKRLCATPVRVAPTTKVGTTSSSTKGGDITIFEEEQKQIRKHLVPVFRTVLDLGSAVQHSQGSRGAMRAFVDELVLQCLLPYAASPITVAKKQPPIPGTSGTKDDGPPQSALLGAYISAHVAAGNDLSSCSRESSSSTTLTTIVADKELLPWLVEVVLKCGSGTDHVALRKLKLLGGSSTTEEGKVSASPGSSNGGSAALLGQFLFHALPVEYHPSLIFCLVDDPVDRLDALREYSKRGDIKNAQQEDSTPLAGVHSALVKLLASTGCIRELTTASTGGSESHVSVAVTGVWDSGDDEWSQQTKTTVAMAVRHLVWCCWAEASGSRKKQQAVGKSSQSLLEVFLRRITGCLRDPFLYLEHGPALYLLRYFFDALAGDSMPKEAKETLGGTTTGVTLFKYKHFAIVWEALSESPAWQMEQQLAKCTVTQLRFRQQLAALCCRLMEGIAVRQRAVLRTGRLNQRLALDILCPLLQKAASHLPAVSRAAKKALLALAAVAGNSDSLAALFHFRDRCSSSSTGGCDEVKEPTTTTTTHNHSTEPLGEEQQQQQQKLYDEALSTFIAANGDYVVDVSIRELSETTATPCAPDALAAFFHFLRPATSDKAHVTALLRRLLPLAASVLDHLLPLIGTSRNDSTTVNRLFGVLSAAAGCLGNFTPDMLDPNPTDLMTQLGGSAAETNKLGDEKHSDTYGPVASSARRDLADILQVTTRLLELQYSMAHCCKEFLRYGNLACRVTAISALRRLVRPLGQYTAAVEEWFPIGSTMSSDDDDDDRDDGGEGSNNNKRKDERKQRSPQEYMDRKLLAETRGAVDAQRQRLLPLLHQVHQPLLSLLLPTGYQPGSLPTVADVAKRFEKGTDHLLPAVGSDQSTSSAIELLAECFAAAGDFLMQRQMLEVFPVLRYRVLRQQDSIVTSIVPQQGPDGRPSTVISSLTGVHIDPTANTVLQQTSESGNSVPVLVVEDGEPASKDEEQQPQEVTTTNYFVHSSQEFSDPATADGNQEHGSPTKKQTDTFADGKSRLSHFVDGIGVGVVLKPRRHIRRRDWDEWTSIVGWMRVAMKQIRQEEVRCKGTPLPAEYENVRRVVADEFLPLA